MADLITKFNNFKIFCKPQQMYDDILIEKINIIIDLVIFWWENNYLKLNKSEYDETLFWIFIDLCHNLVWIKWCIKEGSPVGVKILMRRLLEVAINLNILFHNKNEVYRRLDIYKDFTMARHHELGKNNQNPATRKILSIYEKKAKEKYKKMKILKRIYRTDKAYMCWYNPIEWETSIKTLLKKYGLNTLGDIMKQIQAKESDVTIMERPDLSHIDLYDLYSLNVHPSSTSNGNIKKEDRKDEKMVGYYYPEEFQRDVFFSWCLTYVSMIPILLYFNTDEGFLYRNLFLENLAEISD